MSYIIKTPKSTIRKRIMKLYISDDPEVVKYYVFNSLTIDDPNYYNYNKSFACFKLREWKTEEKNDRNKGTGLMFQKYCVEIIPFSILALETEQTAEEHLEDLGIDLNSVTFCKDVYDFYEKIDYDIKNRKYK